MKPPDDATAMTVSRTDALGKPLIVGKHLAFATEGLLPDGLTRWEAYIAEAERAGELRDAKMRRRAERRDRSLHRELDALKLYANRVKLSEQDVQIRRQALIDAHDARVRESVEREVKIAARARRKRNVLLNLDHDARSRLLKRWALRPSAAEIAPIQSRAARPARSFARRRRLASLTPRRAASRRRRRARVMSRAGLTPAARRAMDRALDGAPDAVERVAQKPPAPATRRRARGRSLARAVPLVAFLDDRPRLKHFSLGFLAGACAMAAIAMEEVKRMVAARDDARRRERDARRRARIEKKAVNKLNSVPIIVEMSDEEAGDGDRGETSGRGTKSTRWRCWCERTWRWGRGSWRRRRDTRRWARRRRRGIDRRR